MSVRNPRTRLISFRLSEHEYHALQSLCDAREARSLSDFVRSTVKRMSQNGDPSRAEFPDAAETPEPGTGDSVLTPESGSNGWELMFARELLELSRRTDALDREIRRLSLLLAKPRRQPQT